MSCARMVSHSTPSRNVGCSVGDFCFDSRKLIHFPGNSWHIIGRDKPKITKEHINIFPDEYKDQILNRPWTLLQLFQFTFHNVACSLIWLYISSTDDKTPLNSFCSKTQCTGNITELPLTIFQPKGRKSIRIWKKRSVRKT